MAASKHKVFQHFTDTDLNFYIRDGVGNVKYIYFYLKVDQITSDNDVKYIVNLIIKQFPNNFTADSEKGKIAYTVNFGGVYSETLFKEATKFINDYLVTIGYKDTKIQRNKTQKTTTAIQPSNSSVAGSLVGLRFKTKSADTIYEITKEDAKNVDLSWKDRNGVYGNTQMGLKETLNFINDGTYIIVNTPTPIVPINASTDSLVGTQFMYKGDKTIFEITNEDTGDITIKWKDEDGKDLDRVLLKLSALQAIKNGEWIILGKSTTKTKVDPTLNNGIRRNTLELNDIFIFTSREEIYKVVEINVSVINTKFSKVACRTIDGKFEYFLIDVIKNFIEEGEVIVLSDINQELKGLQFETSNDIITVTEDVDNGVFVTFLEQNKKTGTLTTTSAKKLFAEELINEKFKFILSSAKNLYKTTATPLTNAIPKRIIESGDYFVFIYSPNINFVQSIKGGIVEYKDKSNKINYSLETDINNGIVAKDVLVLNDINQPLSGLEFENDQVFFKVKGDAPSGDVAVQSKVKASGNIDTQEYTRATFVGIVLFNNHFELIPFSRTATPINSIPVRKIQKRDLFVNINSRDIYFVENIDSGSVFCNNSFSLKVVFDEASINQLIATKDVLVLSNIEQPLRGLEFEQVNVILKVIDDSSDGVVKVQQKIKRNDIISTKTYSRLDLLGRIEFDYEFITSSITTTQQPSATPIVTQNAINPTDDRQLELAKLKSNLSDLMIIKSFINEWDFEERVNVSTLIDKAQKKINDLNFLIIESFSSQKQMLDDLFEQSFTPILPRYDDMVRKGVEDNFAPNGQPSDLSENINQLTKTPAFKEWFGDWENAYFYRNIEGTKPQTSGVLSDNFEPLLVWHGTGAQFSYFKFDNFPAVYFAANRAYSEFFAVNQSKDRYGYVLPFFINIRNPLDLSHFDNRFVEPQEFFDWMYLLTGLTKDELDINPMILSPTMDAIPIWMYIRNNPKMLKKLADSTVFDGIVFYEFCPNIKDVNDPAYSTKAYIIFNPEDAKLADPNRGNLMLASLKSFLLKRGGKI
jgi:hypothetical protein